jgi:hypothetical protein
MKKPYHTDNYKEKSIPHPYESGRKSLPVSSQETGLEMNEEGYFHYPDSNKKEDIKDVITGKNVLETGEETYDREKELLEAISGEDEDEIPERVRNAELHNEIKEREETQSKENNRKYDKYKDYDGKSEIDESNEDQQLEDTTEDNLVDEAENQSLYYERKIAKSKGNTRIDYTQNNFYPNKRPDKDRRHGKERHGNFRDSNRAERQYTKRALKENLWK